MGFIHIYSSSSPKMTSTVSPRRRPLCSKMMRPAYRTLLLVTVVINVAAVPEWKELLNNIVETQDIVSSKVKEIYFNAYFDNFLELILVEDEIKLRSAQPLLDHPDEGFTRIFWSLLQERQQRLTCLLRNMRQSGVQNAEELKKSEEYMNEVDLEFIKSIPDQCFEPIAKGLGDLLYNKTCLLHDLITPLPDKIASCSTSDPENVGKFQTCARPSIKFVQIINKRMTEMKPWVQKDTIKLIMLAVRKQICYRTIMGCLRNWKINRAAFTHQHNDPVVQESEIINIIIHLNNISGELNKYPYPIKNNEDIQSILEKQNEIFLFLKPFQERLLKADTPCSNTMAKELLTPLMELVPPVESEIVEARFVDERKLLIHAVNKRHIILENIIKYVNEYQQNLEDEKPLPTNVTLLMGNLQGQMGNLSRVR